jgi:uncharacterized protein YkwD
MQAELAIINQDRAQYGVGPLSLNQTQSLGTSSCVGSLGHSQAMQQSGSIWHDNANYPAASFPNNICVGAATFGENVGMDGSGNELNDLRTLNTLMMGEQHDAAYCAQYENHACNILNRSYRQVGIGIVYANNITWLTTDFTG